MALLIDEQSQQVADTLRGFRRVVVSAPPGAGKSTRIPQILAQEVYPHHGQILVLQPRRIAARMLALRVASQMGVELGQEVGYQVRFERVCSDKTKILFLTEGLLIRRLLDDRELVGVQAVVLDEFHERSLSTDIALGLLKLLQETCRPDLRLVIMSATLEKDKLLDYLGNQTAFLEIQGKTHPVEIRWEPNFREKGKTIWEKAAEVVANEFPKTAGHALIFMPGSFEISRTVEALRSKFGAKTPIFPLHGEMPLEQQSAAVAPSFQKKIIVATNVAETSLTIEGVTLVVDSGLSRVAKFDPSRGIDTLLLEPISQSSAEQRAGRAGRTAPGVCIRLWSKSSHTQKPISILPEVQRVDLTEVILLLTALGFPHAENFPWLDKPPIPALEYSKNLLLELGAIGADGNLTAVGHQLVPIPVHPRLGRMFLEASKQGCLPQAALVGALIQSRPLFFKKEKFSTNQREIKSDFCISFLALFEANQKYFDRSVCEARGIRSEVARGVLRLAEQFLRMIPFAPMKPTIRFDWPEKAMARCLAVAFADRIACRRSKGTQRFELVHGKRATLPMTSVVASADLVVAAELVEVEGRAGQVECKLGMVTELEEATLEQAFPGEIIEDKEVVFDESLGRVVEIHRRTFRGMRLFEQKRDVDPSHQTAHCLAKYLLSQGRNSSIWGHAEEQFLNQLVFLQTNFPELGLKQISDNDLEFLLENYCSSATTLKDLKGRPLLPTLRAWLSEDQLQILERYAPVRIQLPNGRAAKLQYCTDGSVRLSARIQELYGMEEAPRIGGKVPILMEILAPNHRPIQVTADMRSFWKETYPRIREEFRRKYPKHEWR